MEEEKKKVEDLPKEELHSWMQFLLNFVLFQQEQLRKHDPNKTLTYFQVKEFCMECFDRVNQRMINLYNKKNVNNGEVVSDSEKQDETNLSKTTDWGAESKTDNIKKIILDE